MHLRIVKPDMISFESNMSHLQDYVRRMLAEKNLSGDQVRRRSGDRISQSSVNRIANGILKDPSVRSLQNLARGLGNAGLGMSSGRIKWRTGVFILTTIRHLIYFTVMPLTIIKKMPGYKYLCECHCGARKVYAHQAAHRNKSCGCELAAHRLEMSKRLAERDAEWRERDRLMREMKRKGYL